MNLGSSPAPNHAAVAQLAAAGASGQPIGQMLRAIAAESDSRALAIQLRNLAESIERGQPLEAALQQAVGRMPPDIAGLLQAAQRTGDLPAALVQWLDNRRAATAYWRDTMTALTYPLIASVLALAIFLFSAWFVVPPMKKMFEEFGLKLPPNTMIVIWGSENGSRLACIIVAASIVLAVGIRVLGGRSGWSRVMSAMPIFGDLWHWSSVSEMLRGLRLLLESQIPLPDALRLTADSLRDRYMAVGCARLAQLVSEGQSLSNALESTPVPRSILPLLRSGERQGTLIESIELATELLEVRLKSMSQLVASLAPPLIFLWVVVLIGGTYVSLMMPTVSLIQGLSQGTTLFTGLM